MASANPNMQPAPSSGQGNDSARHMRVQSIFERNFNRLKDANESIALAKTHESLTARAMAYQRLGQYGLAAADYIEAFKLDARLPARDLKNAIICLDRSGKPDKAIELAKDMHWLYDYDFSASLFIGALLYRKEKYDEAAVYLNEAVKTIQMHGLSASKPTFYKKALSYLAMSQYFTDDFEGAIKSFTEIIRLDKDNREAHMRRGQCHLACGHSSMAVDDFMYAHVLDPDDYDAITKLGAALAILGFREEAFSYLEKALAKKGPHYAGALYNMGLFYFDSGDYSKSMECLARSVEENSNYAIMASPYIEKLKDIFRGETGSDYHE
ncbi:MAG: tetratricopeptide repeat protein [Candidatus Micrarchaeia archaeon]